MTKKEDLKRMNKTAKFIIAALVLYIIAILSFSGCNGKTEVIEIEKVDTIQNYDTAFIQLPPEIIYIEKQVPKYITEVKYDTIKEETILITENKIYIDTLCNGNDSIILENSITGINPRLDYTKADWRKSDKVITNTITITKHIKDKKHISVGLQGGYGYAFKSKELSPYVGFGINITI